MKGSRRGVCAIQGGKSEDPKNTEGETEIKQGDRQHTEKGTTEEQEELPLRHTKIKNVPATALLDSAVARSFIRREICKLAGLQEEKLTQEQRFVCANGRELSVSHQVKGVPVQTGENSPHVALLIADASQEMLPG